MKKLALILIAAWAKYAQAACIVNPLGVVDRIVCITVNSGTITLPSATGVVYGTGSAITMDPTNFLYTPASKTLTIGVSQFTFAAGSNITSMTIRAGSSQSTNPLASFQNSSGSNLSTIDSTGALSLFSSGTLKTFLGGSAIQYASDRCLAWKDATDAASGSVDTQICRIASTGGIKFQTGSSSLSDVQANSFTAGTAGNAGRITLEQGTAPGTPAASNHVFYVDGSGDFYQKNPSAVTRRFLYASASAGVLKNDGSLVSGTATDCVLVNGTSGSCGTASGGGGAANYEQSFTSQTSVTLAHSKNSTKVITACYDGSNIEIIPNTTTITDANNVTVTFTSAQTGKCVVNFAGSAKYAAAFSSTTSLSVTGATHALGTCDLSVTIYDNSSPAAIVIPDNVTCDNTSKDYTITFGAAQVGRVVMQ